MTIEIPYWMGASVQFACWALLMVAAVLLVAIVLLRSYAVIEHLVVRWRILLRFLACKHRFYLWHCEKYGEPPWKERAKPAAIENSARLEQKYGEP